jgi:hypothetical protein
VQGELAFDLRRLVTIERCERTLERDRGISFHVEHRAALRMLVQLVVTSKYTGNFSRAG